MINVKERSETALAIIKQCEVNAKEFVKATGQQENLAYYSYLSGYYESVIQMLVQGLDEFGLNYAKEYASRLARMQGQKEEININNEEKENE